MESSNTTTTVAPSCRKPIVGAVDHYQYLGLLGACLAVTLPLEFVYRAGVWRHPMRLLRVVVAPLVVFSVTDVLAIHHRLWRYDGRYITGWDLPGRLPVEEVCFFAVIPVCAILAFQAVRATLER
jgi:lycopene cyclase domain-containing protein